MEENMHSMTDVNLMDTVVNKEVNKNNYLLTLSQNFG